MKESANRQFISKDKAPLGTVVHPVTGSRDRIMVLQGKNTSAPLMEDPIWDDSLPLWKEAKQALEDYLQGVGDVASAVPIAFVGGTAFQAVNGPS